jgi:hypothetical protein
MSLRKSSLLAGLLATLALATSVFADCVLPIIIFAEVTTSLSTVRAQADAAGFAEVRNFQGEVCDFVPIKATVTITQNGTTAKTLTQNAIGSVTLTAHAPAAVGNCYASSILAVASATPLPNGTGQGGEVCWYGPPGPRENSPTCPLILDLNSDGIHTTGLEDPVDFWIDLEGRSLTTAWTNPQTEEAFLWMDLNNDHTAHVTELFGSRMVAPNGAYHANGFDALLKFDRHEFGGDYDGQITHRDRAWASLRLWVDRNHDGVSQQGEISVLSAHRIVALNLAHTEGETYDEHGNELYLIGSYIVRVHGQDTELRTMADIEFRFVPN